MTGTIQYLNIPKSAQTSGLLYVHKQTVPRTKWLINHSMGCVPQIVVYDVTGAVVSDTLYTITPSRNTSVLLTFKTPHSGYCQAYRTEMYQQDPDVVDITNIQASSQSIITLAISTRFILDTGCTSISVTHTFANSISELKYDIDINNGTRGSVTSPWTATTAVSMNSTTYSLCRVDISGVNRDASSLTFKPNTNVPLKSYDACVLLSSPPNKDQADELYHSVIDIIDVNADPNVGSIINGEYIIATKLVRPVFPPIQKR